MGWIKRLLFVFCTGIFLSCQISFAQDLKLFFGPSCDENNEVKCKNPNETAICYSLKNPLSIQATIQPTCSTSSERPIPTCVDIENGHELSPKDAIVDCIRIPVCEDGSIVCPQRAEASCWGSDRSTPDCGIEGLCKEGIAVCDPPDWYAEASNSSYR